MMNKLILVILTIGMAFSTYGQDPKRFADEIETLKTRNKSITVERPIVFAGSSTFRMWTSMQTDLNNPDIVNNGFGGSQYSDLIYYVDPLVLNLNPKALYIYEGDNDLAEGDDPEQVVYEAKLLIAAIKSRIPDIQIFVISAKPSPARFDKKPSFMRYNQFMREYAAQNEGIGYIDFWRILLGKDGQPNPEYYIEDGIHLSPAGYALLAEKINETMN